MHHVLIHCVRLAEEHDMVVRHMKTLGEFEPQSMAVWLESIIPGQIMLDVGAYTGIYSIAAALSGASVIAVEPNPTAAERLKENAVKNGVKITLVESAAGGRQETKTLYIKSDLSSANSFCKNHKKSIQVPVFPLDNIVDRESKVSAIKIDVEGYEPDALLGASRILRDSKPVIITEANTEEARQKQEMFLSQFGYKSPQLVDLRNLIWRHAG